MVLFVVNVPTHHRVGRKSSTVRVILHNVLFLILHSKKTNHALFGEKSSNPMYLDLK